jgi:hypothetical protein
VASKEDEQIRRSKGEHTRAAEDGSKRAETEALPALTTAAGVSSDPTSGKRVGRDVDGNETD